LFLEGVITQQRGKVKFKQVTAPSHSDMKYLVHRISLRIATYLKKKGVIQRDRDHTFLDLPMDDEDTLVPFQAASVSYRIAVSTNTLQDLRLAKSLRKSK
jgi:hypothetical protein